MQVAPDTDRDPRSGEERTADQDLGESEAEYVLAERPQAGGLQLQADHEQEHNHAEFGDGEYRLCVFKHADHGWPDDQSGRQIAEDGAKADPFEDRYGDDGGPEKGHQLDQIDPLLFRHRN